MKKLTFVSVLCGLTALSIMPANAGLNVKPYVGGGFVYNHAMLYDELGEAFSYLTGYNIETEDLINTNHFGFNLNAGLKLTEYFGAELFYQHTFKSTAEIEVYSGYGKESLENKVSSNSFGLDFMGYLPVKDTKWSFIGSLGVGRYEFRLNETYSLDGVPYMTATEKETDGGFRIGVGGEYAFNDNFATRLMIRYVGMDSDEDEDAVDGLIDVSLGLKYTF